MEIYIQSFGALLLSLSILFNLKLNEKYFSISKTIETKVNNVKIDTISGLFLYEINIPSKSYTRFDQIEQSNGLIRYNEGIDNWNIDKLYEKGVYTFSYDHILHSNDFKGTAPLPEQNIYTIQKFLTSISSQKKNKKSIRDKSGIYLFKKIYCKLIVVDMGNRKRLIPKSENYECCYSNYNVSIPTYVIIDVLDYKL